MRYPLAGRETLANLTQGGGIIAGGVGLAAGVAARALTPMALPLALSAGLLWLGRTMGEAFVEIRAGEMRVKLGAIFDEEIALANISGVRRLEWSILRGLGVRSNLRDLVAVTTRSGPVAEIALREATSLPLIPKIYYVSATRLVVSPEKLDSFIADLSSRLDTA